MKIKNLYILCTIPLFSLIVFQNYQLKRQLNESFRIGLDLSQKLELDYDQAPSIGSPQARIEIIIFSDFNCPICKEATEMIANLQRRNPGLIRFVYKHFPIEPDSLLKAKIACGGYAQGKFWEIHDLLQAGYSGTKLEKMASSIGVDMGELNKEVDSGLYNGLINQDIEDAKELGIWGTPAIFINGYKVAFPNELIMEQMIKLILIKMETND